MISKTNQVKIAFAAVALIAVAGTLATGYEIMQTMKLQSDIAEQKSAIEACQANVSSASAKLRTALTDVETLKKQLEDAKTALAAAPTPEQVQELNAQIEELSKKAGKPKTK